VSEREGHEDLACGSAWFGRGRTITNRVDPRRIFGLKTALLAFYGLEKVRDTREGWESMNIV